MIAYQKLNAVAGKKGKARERALILSSDDKDISSADEEEVVIEERNRSNPEERPSGLKPRGVEIINRLLSPLVVFLPATVFDSAGIRSQTDWSLALLALTLFAVLWVILLIITDSFTI